MKSNSFRAAKYSIGVFLTVIGLTYGLSIPLRSSGTAAASNTATGAASPSGATGMMVGTTVTATKSVDVHTHAHLGDTLTYTVVITNTGGTAATSVNFLDTIDANTTLVPNSLAISPIAVDDTYNTIGNVNISVPAGSGVLANDLNPGGMGSLTVTQVNGGAVGSPIATTHGSVTMAADGSFTYNPTAGFSGPSDSFTYTLGNGTGKTDMATVTINIAGRIWFVNSAAGSNGDGRLSTPFNILTGAGSADSVDAANDVIFLYSSATNYTGGMTLNSGERIIGQGASQSILSITGFSAPSGTNLLPATGGSNPTITAASADEITIGSNNQIWGTTFGTTTGTSINSTGTAYGTFKVRDTTINNGNGRALNLSNGTADVILQSLSSTNSSTTGMTVDTSAGSLSVTGTTSVTNSGSNAVNLTTNTATITFAALNITNTTSNKNGLNATQNTNTITTTSGAINTGSGTAVTITRSSSTTPLAVSLTSVSANGGTNGIFLSNTSGSFTVNGDGTSAKNGSGGTIQSLTGADASPVQNATVGVGVYMNNATNVSLNRMNLHDFSNYGVIGTNVTGFTMTWSVMSGTNGTNHGGVGEGTIYFTGLSGSATVSDCDFSGGAVDTFHVFNDGSQSLNRITITSCSFAMTDTAGGDAIGFQATGGTFNATVQSSTVTSARSDQFQLNLLGTVTSDLVFGGSTPALGNTLTNNNTNIVSGGGGVTIGGGGPSNNITLTYNISHNSMKGSHGAALAVFKGTGTGASLTGTIDSNVIGTSGTSGSGSTQGEGIAVFHDGAGSSTTTITNNQVFGVVGSRGAIDVFVHNGAAGTMKATVQSNTIGTLDQTNSFAGMYIQTGSNTVSSGSPDNNNSCMTIGGAGSLKNSIDVGTNTMGAIAAGITVEQEGDSKVALPGYAGTAYDSTAVQNFVGGNNTVTGSNAQAVLALHDSSSPAGFGFSGNCAAIGLPDAHIIDGPDLTAQRSRAGAQTPGSGDILEAARGTGHNENPQKVNEQELLWLAQAAIQRWRDAGISEQDLVRFQQVTFEIATLPERQIALADSSHIKIDETAAGYGWYFDQTPYEDSEFAVPVPAKELHATEMSPANGKMDLLTVVMREFGHVYLQGKTRIPKFMRPLMEGTLSPGVRRLPSYSLVQISAPAADTSTQGSPGLTSSPQASSSSRASGKGITAKSQLTPQSGETINQNLGTIPVGKSITMMFQVTINNSVPAGTLKVCNQGSVSGGNFTTVMTNDPSTAGPSQPTCTTLCVPAVVNTAITNQQVAQGSTATFTTTIQGTVPFTFVWKQGATTLNNGDRSGRVTITTTTNSGAGTTTSTLSISNAMLSDASPPSYTVDPTDACGVAVATESATLTVVQPPTVMKSFSPTTIPVNGATTLTLTLTNPNASVTLTGVNFSDNMTGGLQVANPAGIGSTCTGTWNATPGDTTLNFGGGTLAPGTSCTLTVKITSTSAGIKTNATNAPQSTEGGTGVASNTATLTVVGPPTIQKSFASSTVALGGLVNLNFTITNPNNFVGGDLTGIAFTDTLPSGLTVADSGPTTTCGGTLTTVNSTGKITFSGGSVAHGASPTTCTFSVPVTGATAGLQSNTTGTISSNQGGTGNTSNTATVTVVAPPSISKMFTPSTIANGGMSTLSFTITNPNTTAAGDLTGVAFTDTLPTGVVVTTPATTSQCGGTLTTTTGNISLSGATVAHGGNCTFSVTVTGTTSGVKHNVTNNVSSANGGTGNTAMADLTVASAPTIMKSFTASSIQVGQMTSLNFTLSNPNAALPLTAVSFTDTLPTGITVPTGSASVCGGTVTTTSPNMISFSGGMLAAGGNCMFSVTVTGASPCVCMNTTGQISSTESGLGATSNTATITVIGQPTISKSFSASTICTGGVATLTFTIMNPNSTTAFTGISFTDALPSGLVVAPTPNASTTCGSGSFSPAAASGDTSLSFSGGMVAANSQCTVQVDVTGTTTGAKNNTSGPVSSNEGGTGGTSNQATITVVAPPVAVADTYGTQKNTPLNQGAPGVLANDTLNGASIFSYGATTGGEQTTIGAATPTSAAGSVSLNSNGSFSYTPASNFTGVDTFKYVLKSPGGCTSMATVTINVATAPTIMKSFVPSTILLNGTTSLTFTIMNPNSTQGLTGIAFTDTLPAGITVANGSSAACGGGTVTTSGGNLISFSGGSIAGGGMCTFSVTVTGSTTGVWNNTTGTISSTESGAGATSNTATLTVVGPPSIMKGFDASTIPLNGTSVLTFTISNPNTTTAFTGVAFTDTLPAGLTVPNGSSTVCGGGTLTTTAPNMITLSGGAIGTSTTCSFSVTVTGTTAGVKNNLTGNVSAANGGTGGTANASITVVAPPVISKMFGAANIPLNGTTSLTFSITNPNSTVGLTGINFSDTLPSGLTVPNDAGSSHCGGTLTINSNIITFNGGSLAAGANCSFSVTVTGTTAGVKNNMTTNVGSANGGVGNAASASVTVATAPTIMKSFGQSSILLNGTTSLTFSIMNPNSTQGLTGIAFTDTLPAGITVANGSSAACGGGTVTTSGGNLISFSGGSIAGGGMCTFSVTVTGSTTGVWSNTTGAISSNESGTGATSNTVMLTVVGPPSITKAFDAGTIPLNGTSVLSFTITNPNTTTAFTGVAFTDTLPAGLTVPNGSSAVCGGGTLTTTAPNMISLTGGAIGTSTTCSFSVTVTGTTAGVKNNLTGNVSAANGGTGGTANASITVVAPPTIAKSFGAANIPLNGTTSLTFTVTNPNSTVALNGVSFSDTLPAGLTTSNNAGSSQCGGTLTVTGNNLIVLSGATIAASGTCTFSVTVTGTTGGVKNNQTTPASSTNGGTGATGASASVTVASAPTIMKSFMAATIPLGGTTSLTFTITNTNASLGITGVSFTDTLPAGLTVANGSSPACGGGTVTTSGGNLISFSGGSIAGGGMCTFSVTVTGTTAGVKNNTTGNISSNESGAGTTSNTAMVTVVAPPTISKSFVPSQIPLNQTTSLSFTITNPNSTVGLTGVTVTDTLPSGLTVATGSASGCGGGTVTTTAPNTITLTGGTIAQGSNCIFSVTVTGTTAGMKNNSTGNVSSANGGTGTNAMASITVVAPPTIMKSFSKTMSPIMGVVTMSFTITNPNATVALTGVGFTDTFPSGMIVATPPNAMDTCGGTFAPLPNDQSLTFTGGTVAAGGSCTLSVDVKLTTSGTKTNTTGPITSTEGGTGTTSTATVATFDICLKDNSTGDLLQWDSGGTDPKHDPMAGSYLFTHCGPGGFTLTGKGTVGFANGIKTLSDTQPDRSISNTGFNTATLTGTANVYTISGGVHTLYHINDTNPHILCQCGPNAMAPPVRGSETDGRVASGGSGVRDAEPAHPSWLAIGWQVVRQTLRFSGIVG